MQYCIIFNLNALAKKIGSDALKIQFRIRDFFNSLIRIRPRTKDQLWRISIFFFLQITASTRQAIISSIFKNFPLILVCLSLFYSFSNHSIFFSKRWTMIFHFDKFLRTGLKNWINQRIIFGSHCTYRTLELIWPIWNDKYIYMINIIHMNKEYTVLII